MHSIFAPYLGTVGQKRHTVSSDLQIGMIQALRVLVRNAVSPWHTRLYSGTLQKVMCFPMDKQFSESPFSWTGTSLPPDASIKQLMQGGLSLKETTRAVEWNSCFSFWHEFLPFYRKAREGESEDDYRISAKPQVLYE